MEHVNPPQTTDMALRYVLRVLYQDLNRIIDEINGISSANARTIGSVRVFKRGEGSFTVQVLTEDGWVEKTDFTLIERNS